MCFAKNTSCILCHLVNTLIWKISAAYGYGAGLQRVLIHGEVPWKILLGITVSTTNLIPGDVIYLADKLSYCSFSDWLLLNHRPTGQGLKVTACLTTMTLKNIICIFYAVERHLTTHGELLVISAVRVFIILHF